MRSAPRNGEISAMLGTNRPSLCYFHEYSCSNFPAKYRVRWCGREYLYGDVTGWSMKLEKNGRGGSRLGERKGRKKGIVNTQDGGRERRNQKGTEGDRDGGSTNEHDGKTHTTVNTCTLLTSSGAINLQIRFGASRESVTFRAVLCRPPGHRSCAAC